MKHRWRKNLKSNVVSEIKIELFNIAFMDDTTWIGKGKKEIEK